MAEITFFDVSYMKEACNRRSLLRPSDAVRIIFLTVPLQGILLGTRFHVGGVELPHDMPRDGYLPGQQAHRTARAVGRLSADGRMP